jgi:hypothetical protein
MYFVEGMSKVKKIQKDHAKKDTKELYEENELKDIVELVILDDPNDHHLD